MRSMEEPDEADDDEPDPFAATELTRTQTFRQFEFTRCWVKWSVSYPPPSDSFWLDLLRAGKYYPFEQPLPQPMQEPTADRLQAPVNTAGATFTPRAVITTTTT